VIPADDHRRRPGGEDAIDARLDRRVRRLDPDRRRVDVSRVHDGEDLERRDLLEVGVGPDERRLRPDLARPHPRARTVRCAAVERHAQHRDVNPREVGLVRQPHERRRLREPRTLAGIELFRSHQAL
jgi:hypothetical protein